jgi:hypothetical protein
MFVLITPMVTRYVVWSPILMDDVSQFPLTCACLQEGRVVAEVTVIVLYLLHGRCIYASASSTGEFGIS